MLRGFSRVSRLLLASACLSLVAVRAEAITIDSFDGGALVDPLGMVNNNSLGSIVFDMNSDGTYDILSSALLGFSSVLKYTFPSATSQLAGTNVIEIEFGSAVAAPPATFSVSVTVDGITPTVPIQTFSSVGQPYPLVLGFDFGASSEAGLTSVGEIIVTIGTTNPGAFSLNEIRAVPEPSTAAMLGLGLFGLAVAGRRQTA